MNRKLILVINTGSSSIKFAVYRVVNTALQLACSGAISGMPSNPIFSAHTMDSNRVNTCEPVSLTPKDAKNNAFLIIQTWLSQHFNVQALMALAYRVVHGGDLYDKPVAIDQKVIEALQTLVPFAPLHQPRCLETIEHFMKAWPQAQHWACFDTAFHRTMPLVAQTFALPEYIRSKGVKPYGFHGLSYQSILNQINAFYDNALPSRIIIAHLGSGSSICAVKNGKSIATTMTFSPLDGLPMSTRCGRLDPGAVLYMINQLHHTPQALLQLLNHDSGLAGLSGLSGDIQELLLHSSEEAQFAIEFYVNNIVRAIGEMTALLQGVDVLVFTGGVGSNSAEIREQVCQHFQWLGLHMDTTTNCTATKKNTIIKLSRIDSKIDVFSVKTNEELVMAQSVLSRLV